jgi:Fe-S-cluster-containing hydrogenase component 2
MFGGLLRPGPEGMPRTTEDFAALAGLLGRDAAGAPASIVYVEHGRRVALRTAPAADSELQVHRLEKGQTVYAQGDPADALYLILDGRVRIVLGHAAGGRSVVNYLDANGYFGEGCVQPDSVRKATVEAHTRVHLLRIDRTAVARLLDQYPGLGDRMRRESNRFRARDEDVRAGRRPAPDDPPPDIAGKLMLATNLLRIDMDLCTRCDQCVRACAEAHDDRPRFHRANPSLRFGKWEIAAACAHCADAPCLEACPVGAITILDRKAVQILRNRCIGCEACVPACPFDVIDMYPAASKFDTANPDKLDEKMVASKCDLCLTPPGKDPPCVASCPYDAARRGTPEELFPDIKGQAVAADAAARPEG